MVKLEEVLDEEFSRAQEGPEVEDEWDTDSGTFHALNGPFIHTEADLNAPQSPKPSPTTATSPVTKPLSNASQPSKM